MNLWTQCGKGKLGEIDKLPLTYMDWMKHKMESRLLGEITITSDIQMALPLWEKVKRN